MNDRPFVFSAHNNTEAMLLYIMSLCQLDIWSLHQRPYLSENITDGTDGSPLSPLHLLHIELYGKLLRVFLIDFIFAQ